MLTFLRPSLVLMLLFTALLGLVYPLAITGIAQAVSPFTANGSVMIKEGGPIGSDLIGQQFASEIYFHSRPSATSATDPNDATQTIDAPYNAMGSSGSNLGPLSQKLVDRVKADIAALGVASVPADSVTTSASGLDPDISPANAMLQIERVAKARSVDAAKIAELVRTHIDSPVFGIFGEARVNVLRLNLALDSLSRS